MPYWELKAVGHRQTPELTLFPHKCQTLTPIMLPRPAGAPARGKAASLLHRRLNAAACRQAPDCQTLFVNPENS